VKNSVLSSLRRCFWLAQRGTNLELRRLEKPKIIDNILFARYGLGMVEHILSGPSAEEGKP